ncbi:MAG: DUF4124 domain-containing protein [gamma proteobacterium symbiont of Bathyaustriella thionipta]|nr:DUF4124 domain-containing protein [gamma proteobacterium symbiont of Bathyaustriella thionipta]
MNKLLFSVLMLCLVSVAVSAEFYKWVDDEGVTHYTATPPGKGAEKLKLREPTYYTPRDMPDSIYADKKQPGGLPGSYQTLQFVSPENDATIRSNEGIVDFSLQLEPPLQADDVLKVSLDGQLIDQPLTGLRHKLTNIDRGSHTLQARIENKQGKTLITSKTVTFHLRQHSILHPGAVKPVPLPGPI